MNAKKQLVAPLNTPLTPYGINGVKLSTLKKQKPPTIMYITSNTFNVVNILIVVLPVSAPSSSKNVHSTNSSPPNTLTPYELIVKPMFEPNLSNT